MDKIDFTIKNYRCFDDSNPARLSIVNGITSFVGPNNSGKSSLLKMFREFREVWRALSNPHQLFQIASKRSFNCNIEFVNDQLEVFTDSNTRPLIIEVEIDPFTPIVDAPANAIFAKKLVLSLHRKNPSNWNVELHSPQFGLLIPGPFQYGTVNGANQINVSGTWYAAKFEELASAFASLCNSIYIGPFRNAINVGTGNYYDISIGEGFINIWNEWKTGPTKANNLAISRLTEDIRHIFGFSSLEITASTQLKTLQININSKSYKLAEVGSGLAQFIVVFGNVLTKAPDVLLIDEPELNLHPSLQIDFTTTLAKYARESTLMATHSIGLARSVSDVNIYSFQKKNHHSVVSQLERTMNYCEFLGEMNFSTYRDMGFDKILLVEGTTDVKTIQQFLRKLNKDHKIVVMPLGGDSLARANVELELAEIKRLSSNIVVLVDSERTSADGPAAQRRKAFADICERLGYRTHLTNLRSTENYLTDAAIKEIKGDKYNALRPFERLEDAKLAWAKSENWRIANAMSWDDIAQTDLGIFLASL